MRRIWHTCDVMCIESVSSNVHTAQRQVCPLIKSSLNNEKINGLQSGDSSVASVVWTLAIEIQPGFQYVEFLCVF